MIAIFAIGIWERNLVRLHTAPTSIPRASYLMYLLR